MISKYNNYLFIFEDILCSSPQKQEEWVKFINKIPVHRRYFFTLNPDFSRKTLSNMIKNLNINYDFNNVLTPSYLMLSYCKTLYTNLTIYPISTTMDFHDFYISNIKIDFANPNLIIVNTSNMSKEYLNALSHFNNIPIIFSSILCTNRFDKCVMCNENCNLRYIKSSYRTRLIIPDSPPSYDVTYLFKKFNIDPKETVLVTCKIRNDYLQCEKAGCQMVLVLNEKYSKEDYIDSSFDINLVVDNLNNLSYFLNLKEEI
ncbi:hypothetical protein GCM10008905_26660 [Clostridium malenominatum]|uniref:Uncharacterized protein n=1 Tax=Clostridium malenominatum TaxID=1539 RepID=A0ABP3UCW5_9CLOT